MKRILVVDDRDTSRELIRTVLENCGYAVTEACDGAQAVEIARQIQPDLILLDLQMPRLDGFNALALIRGDPRFQNLPVVAVTASAMQGDEQKALDAGFTSYLSKPVQLARLRSEVARLLS